MSQITKAFCEQMLHHAANKEHSPLTIWEEEQLARAWLEREQLRADLAKEKSYSTNYEQKFFAVSAECAELQDRLNQALTDLVEAQLRLRRNP